MLPVTQLKFFADYIQKELGIVYSEQIYYQLQQRLDKVVEYLKLKDADALYFLAVKEGITGDFRNFLLDIATNNETSFFRDIKVFSAIEKVIIPQLCSDFPGSFSFRIWSAASSFGQEPYSLAMLAYEAREKNSKLPRIEIRATDISDQALRRAQMGRYTQLEVQRGLESWRLEKYFTKLENSEWQLKPEISSLVDFSKKNLLEPFSSLGKFHIILCRYALIYQDTEKKKDIMDRLVQNLHPKGYLVLGGSESATSFVAELEQLDFAGAVIYRRR